MNLILCCGKMSLRDRWFTALVDQVDHYTLYQAGALQELSILVKNRISFDLMLLHRPLLDTETMLYIREKIPACKLFVLSDRPSEQEGLAFLRLGAVGYANSYISSARLQEAVRVIAAGSVWVNQSLLQHLIATMAAATDAGKTEEPPAPGATRAMQRLQLLTRREHEIAQLVSQGASNAAIAEQLGISERTVKSHLSAIYAKTATQGRLGLALLINSS